MKTLPMRSGDRVAFHSAAIGPGGAIIATDGTAEEPRLEIVPAVVDEEEDGDDGFPVLPVVLGVTGAVVLGAAIAIIVAVAVSGNDGTQPMGPVIER